MASQVVVEGPQVVVEDHQVMEDHQAMEDRQATEDHLVMMEDHQALDLATGKTGKTGQDHQTTTGPRNQPTRSHHHPPTLPFGRQRLGGFKDMLSRSIFGSSQRAARIQISISARRGFICLKLSVGSICFQLADHPLSLDVT